MTDIDYITGNFNSVCITKDSIDIKDFDINVPGKQIFKNASLTISSGNIYGLMGKNGSGKSTLLKQISSVRADTNNESIKINTLYVEQEIVLDDRFPIDYVFDSNIKFVEKQKKLDDINKILESEDIDNM